MNHPALKKHIKTVSALLLTIFTPVIGDTIAYWRFEQGPADSNAEAGFSVMDISGNGNHLSPWTEGGNNGYRYRTDIAIPEINATGQPNIFSVQNTGSAPSLATRSTSKSYGTGSYPAGIDVESAQLSQFTVEAIFKPEGGNHRTIVGRDARNIAGDANLAAFYLQIRPDSGISAVLSDVTGTTHRADSAAAMITGFNFGEDPHGLTGRWYYVAAVSNGSTLSLYLANLTAGTDPLLVAEEDLNDSTNPTMAIGTTSGSTWHAGGWSVGRGLYSGNKTDYAYGFIDEVRISNTALNVSQFLIEPKSIANVNPLFNAADPSIMLKGNFAYIYPTSGDSDKTYVYYSSDMVNWRRSSPILSFKDVSWMVPSKNCWAPGIFEKNGKYYLYYSVGPKPSYIGVAVSSTPYTTFIDSGQPLIADNGESWFEAIDPMTFEDPQTGKVYLYFGGSAGSRLRVFELNDDLISLGNEINVDNPPNFTEGAFMHYRKGKYHLTYSHGSWNRGNYSLHYCTSSSPTGPWDYHGAILESDGWFKGPGHHSIMYNPAMDQWYVCYHRWNERFDDGPYSGSRSTCIDMLYYDDNGLIMPIVQTDTGVGPVRLGERYIADFNDDKTVDLADLQFFANEWLKQYSDADITPVRKDNKVNMQDFEEFAEKYWMVTPEQ